MGDTSIESRLYSAVTGLDMSEEESYAKGDMLSSLERAIGCLDGRTRQDDVLYEKYYNNLDAADRKYNREDLEKAKSGFYQLKGCHVTTGVPSQKKLKSLGLKEVAEELENRGVPPKSREE